MTLLAKVAFNPPRIDSTTLEGLLRAEETLRKGSKSFEVAKLAFGREMRIALVGIYAWCRVTVSLADGSLPATLNPPSVCAVTMACYDAVILHNIAL